MDEWCVWVQLPIGGGRSGWTCMAEGLTEAESQRFASACTFPARAMTKGGSRG